MSFDKDCGAELDYICRALTENFDHSVFNYDVAGDVIAFFIAPGSGRERVCRLENYVKDVRSLGFMHPDCIASFENAILMAMRRPVSGKLEFLADFEGGTSYLWYRAYYMSAADASGAVTRVFGRVCAIQSEKEQERRRIRREAALQQKADYDAVTRIFNRATTEERISSALASGASPSAFAIFDVDNFKALNDCFGHPFGDMILRRVAEKVSESCRKTDVFGRVGGDEFVIFLPGAGDPAYIVKKLGSIIEGIEELSNTFSSDVSLSISMGAAITGCRDRDFSQVFRRADAALYEAKQTGKNRLVMYSPDSCD